MNSNHTNRNKAPLDFETERPSYKEKLPHFRSHLKIIKKPLTSSKHHFKKFNIDKLIKINQNKRPININIQNLNINNYNYYNGSQPMLIKRRINTAEVNNFPMITNTCPNDNINRVNIFNSNNNIFEQRRNRIKLINVKKMNNITYDSTKHRTIEKKYQNRKIDLVEDNNDSFIDELTDLLKNVEVKNKVTSTEMNSELDFDQSEIEINVDVVNQNNYQERPQTSYGGIKDRKRKMKQSSK